jgi:hypothetical protein
MNPTDRFTKVYDELIALGLSPRLVLLYGRLVYHAGKDGKCYPKQSTLAKEIGLTSRRSRAHVLRLLKELRRLRLIEWTRGRYSNAYQVLNPDVTFLRHQMSSGCDISDVTKMRHRKESSSKEGSKEEEKPRPKSARQRAVPHEPPETPNTKTKTSDDDEKPKPRPHALTEAEFRDALRERHGETFDAERCIQNIKRQLEKCSGLSMTDFLRYDAEHTTAPKAIHNPHGFYTQLAKQLRHATVAAGLTGAFDPLRAATAPPEPPRDERGLCKACGGPGVLKDGAFCTCPMGRGLEQLARRDKAQAAKKGPAAATEPDARKVPKFSKGATR